MIILTVPFMLVSILRLLDQNFKSLSLKAKRHIFPFHFYIYVTCKICLHRNEPWHGKDTETAPLHFQWFDLYNIKTVKKMWHYASTASIALIYRNCRAYLWRNPGYSRWQPWGLSALRPKKPVLHLSQRGPSTLTLQRHWPPTKPRDVSVWLSHMPPFREPSGSQSQAIRHERIEEFYFLKTMTSHYDMCYGKTWMFVLSKNVFIFDFSIKANVMDWKRVWT